MASASTASTSYGSGKEFSPFDVFISVGSDVKKGLATHLYQRLTRLELRVFLNMEELQAGDNLPPEIEGAIKTASVHIAIFSPLYAESCWCLHELVQMQWSFKTFIPVFYKVNPSDLRWPEGGDGVYARTLRALEMETTFDSKPRYDSHTLEKWREALSYAADRSGLELRAYDSDEALLVEAVVKQVFREVGKTLDVAKYPTGLEDKVEDFERMVLSHQQSEKTTVVGIVGMCVVGKTTLAKELFNRHRENYDQSCFLFDVREEAARGYLNVLQSRLLKDLAQLDVHISSTNEGVESLKMHLRSSQQVLVVIDDVDNSSQLDALVSPIQHTVHPSSLILVTSRDKGLLIKSGINESLIYQQTGLNRAHSLELFCSHAFNQPYPAPGFEQLVREFLNVCNGLPLSLKVIGALLYGKDLKDWEVQLLKMRKMLPDDILGELKIIYDRLDEEKQQILLDIACFLIGEDMDTAIRIWDGSRWQGSLGLRNLEMKSLVDVDSENCIRMHNQVRDLGRDIAKKVTPHRLWRSDDILPDHSSVRGISMVHETDPEESFEIPTNIRGLQLLRAHGNTVERIFRNARSPQLVWLSWYSFPFSSLPSWISVENLRVLHVQGENLKTMWEHESQAPLQLRELDIDANILNVPKSIGNLKHLEKFVLRRRKYFGADTVDLETLPDEVHGMHSLKHLELVGCKNLRFLPDSAGKWTSLERIDLGGCSSLEKLPESAANWTSLQRIDLGGCSSLRGLPESAEKWTSLQRIDLGRCSSLQGLPESAWRWTKLQRIDLGGCSSLLGLPKSAWTFWTSLQRIDLGGCSSLRGLPESGFRWRSLQRIDLGGCSSLPELPESVENWTSLQRIDLGGCSSLRKLPKSVGNWTSLQRIDLGGCSSLQGLPESARNWTSLQRIDFSGCSSLQRLPESVGNWTSLQRIDFSGCSSLRSLPASAGNWTSLQRIDLGGCSSLWWLPVSAVKWTSLQRIDLGGCSSLRGLPVPEGKWTSLEWIDLGGCSSLRELPESVRNWTSLQRIDLGGCSSLRELPESVGNWTSLQRIDFSGCSSLQGLPESAGNWTSLQRIDLGGCSSLRGLPVLAGNWTSLEWIDLGGCSALQGTNLEYSLLEEIENRALPRYVYDVFINCHGPDVERTFANHLYHRLVGCGLRPFIHEERHEADNIATQIKGAIAAASVHVAIFSLRYAESRRCLDELLLMSASGAPVIPVFYNVKRFDLQCKLDKDGVYAGVYGRALQNHEKGTTYDSQTSAEKPRDKSNTIDEWRKALHGISVPEISGFELEAFKYDEAELLDAVLKSVLEKVRKAPFYEVKYLKDLDQKVEDFENTVLLHRQNRKPQVVGIVGVAGVGKTTLAKELVNRKSSSFNRACFLFDVSGTAARSSLHFLQSKLLKDLTNMNIQIGNVPQDIEPFTKHFSSIHGASAFVILDNVDDVHQLEALLPVKEILPSKSLILITSRSKDVLISSGVEQSLIYNLTDLPLDKHPSCLDGKVKDLTNKILLQQQSKEPQVLGIVGISGIGKTRLAMEFFNRKSSDYTRSYFFHDVNETARTSSTLHNLQSKLLQGLLQLDLQVQEVDESIDLFKEHVSYFRSLVILDNVDHWDQLHALLSVLTVLPSGSLILVTCRAVEVLKRSGVQESSIYKINHLNTEDSLELFCTQAFGEPSPRQEFEDLIAEFVRACNGLPLTLKVFGALLCGKNTSSYWKEQLHKLHQIHPDQIEKRLKLCYDELNEEEQKIFLHIACSCVGAKRDFAVRVWDASGSRGLSVFESLQKRCLVDVDSEDCLIMHEYLRELGRTIADEKGLRRPPQPRRENDSDLLRRSSSTTLTITVGAVITMITAMMIWNMRRRN